MTAHRLTTADVDASYQRRLALAHGPGFTHEDRLRFARVATARMAELEGIAITDEFWLPAALVGAAS